jgi:hypothetical protein
MRETADAVLAEKAATEHIDGTPRAAAAADPDTTAEAAEAESVLASAADAYAQGDLADQWQAGDTTGIREDSPLVMPMLLPVPRGPDAVDWIMRNIVAHGRGTHLCVGRVAGHAYRADHKENEWQGKKLEAIVLNGLFRMQSTVDPKLIYENAELYLPLNYAKKVEAELKLSKLDGADRVVTIDADIGIEATGRTIPYRWSVISRFRSRSASALDKLWSRRDTSPGLIAGPAKSNGNGH